MFGPWGEMHSTTFGQSPEAYAWLLDAWLDAVPESRSIIVQGGAFLSWYNHRYGTHYTFEDIDQIPRPENGTPEARFRFFNDSYAYGEDEGDNYPNDWGSLSEGAGWPGDPLGDEDSYDRGRIMTWIRNQNNFYGGEAQGDQTRWNTYPFVAWEASYAQTVYLNADYEDQVHDRWGSFIYNEENVTKKMTNTYKDPYKTEYAIFDPVYDGRTGIEHWRDRLGYRLVMREANASEWVKQNGTLRFEGKIQNVGFGNVVNKKNVSVILKAKGSPNTYTALTDLDARDWRPDLDSRASNTAAYRDMNFSIKMSAFGKVPAGDYDIYLKVNDPKETSTNKRCIQFANHDIWNASLGANLIGSTTVRNNSFDDVRESAWYYGDVEYVNNQGLMTGTSVSPMLFSPDIPLTRGVIVTVLYRHSGNPSVSGLANPFSDVAADKYYASAVKWAAANGVAVGWNGKFRPNDNVTRQDLAVILTRYADLAGIELPKTREYADFADGGAIADYARDAAKRCYSAAIIGGKQGNLFDPKGNATRADAAAMLHRLLAE
jgi:hypothetical protein